MATRITKSTAVQTTAHNVADTNEKARDYSAIFQTVYLIFGVINILLLIRFFFKLTGASTAAMIVDLIYAVTDIFMLPYKYIFPQTAVEGAVFEWSVLVAIIFYMFLAWLINRIIAIVYTQDTD